MKTYDNTPTFAPQSYYYQRSDEYNEQLVEELLRLIRKGHFTYQDFYDFCEAKGIEWF